VPCWFSVGLCIQRRIGGARVDPAEAGQRGHHVGALGIGEAGEGAHRKTAVVDYLARKDVVATQLLGADRG